MYETATEQCQTQDTKIAKTFPLTTSYPDIQQDYTVRCSAVYKTMQSSYILQYRWRSLQTSLIQLNLPFNHLSQPPNQSQSNTIHLQSIHVYGTRHEDPSPVSVQAFHTTVTVTHLPNPSPQPSSPRPLRHRAPSTMGTHLSTPALSSASAVASAAAAIPRRPRARAPSAPPPSPLLQLPDDVLVKIMAHLSAGAPASAAFSRCPERPPLAAAVGPQHAAGGALALASTCRRLYLLHRTLHVRVLDLSRREGAAVDAERRLVGSAGMSRALGRFPGVRSVVLRGADLERQSLAGEGGWGGVRDVYFQQASAAECDVEAFVAFVGALSGMRRLEADTGFSGNIWARVIDKLPREMQAISMRQQFWESRRRGEDDSSASEGYVSGEGNGDRDGGETGELDLRKLAVFEGLRTFEFAGPRFLFHPYDFDAIAALTGLTSLKICAGLRLDSESFEKVRKIGGLVNLETLSLCCVVFSAQCAANLPDLIGFLPVGLRVLDFECSRACKHIAPAPFPPAAFQTLPHLETLAIYGSAVRFDSWNAFVDVSPALLELEIGVRKVNFAQDIQHIVPWLSGLRRLKFCMKLSSRPGPALAEFLSLPHLSSLYLSLTNPRPSSMWSPDLSEAFANARCGDSLQTLALQNFGQLSDKIVRAIVFSLPQLTSLQLCDSAISETGLQILRIGMPR